MDQRPTVGPGFAERRPRDGRATCTVYNRPMSSDHKGGHVVAKLAGLLGAITLLVGCSGADEADTMPPVTAGQTPDETAPDPTHTAPVPDVPVAEIEQALTSGDEDVILDLVRAPAGADIDAAALSELTRTLAGAELDPEGMSVLGEGVVTIPAEVDGAQWLFYLALTDGEWALALTEELP